MFIYKYIHHVTTDNNENYLEITKWKKHLTTIFMIHSQKLLVTLKYLLASYLA